jgi:hypothetical protein
MKIRVQGGLPFVSLQLTQGKQSIILRNVVLDTGSAGTILQTDLVTQVGVRLEPDDLISEVHGIGGVEFVVAKQVDLISVDGLATRNFTIEIGAMDYGFNFDGILGFDFLQQTGAVIDLAAMEIRSDR